MICSIHSCHVKTTILWQWLPALSPIPELLQLSYHRDRDPFVGLSVIAISGPCKLFLRHPCSSRLSGYSMTIVSRERTAASSNSQEPVSSSKGTVRTLPFIGVLQR